MKHARKDYDPIQDPRGLIPEDEPVFLLRAQDICAPAVVETWAFRASEAGADTHIVAAARAHALKMREWQGQHGAQIPDMPEDA